MFGDELTRPGRRGERFARRGAVAALVAIAWAGGACSGCPGGEPDGPPEASSPDAAEGEEHVQIGAHDLVADTGGWQRILERGTLRVLVPSTEEAFLPRRGTPGALDRRLVREFAQRHGLDVQFILVPEHDRLLPLLGEGIGDLVAAQLTETESRAEDAAFTWPLRTVEEILVGRRGDEGAPRSIEELAGREVHVRADSAYADTLRELAAEDAPELEIVPVHERIDTETIIYDVTQGERPLTVADSHILAAVESYNDDAERLLTLREGREIAWALRPDNTELKGAVDSFLVEAALARDDDPIFAGDLSGIRDRGTLRVLTRNNPVTYFLYRGERHGFEYELARMLAEALGVRLEMVVPPSRDALIPWLLEGRGDIIAASMTITPTREERVAFSAPYLHVDEVVVGPAGEVQQASARDAGAPEPITELADLAGRAIHVRRSSSYHDTLTELAEEIPLSIEEVPEELETQQILAMVADGEIPLTVADTHILQVERAHRDDIQPLVAVTGGASSALPEQVGLDGSKSIAFAMRPGASELAEFVDGFVESLEGRERYQVALRRYFERRRGTGARRLHRPSEDGRISGYDPVIQRFADQYGLDWRLMAALAWRESRFDPRAKSWVGARGLFQVMPKTGRALGFGDLTNPAQGAHAGIMYFHRLLSRLDPRVPFQERILFALAGYNTGLGHVADARRLAAQQGLDPNLWFDNVEKAMLLLSQPQYHRNARHGYVRGHEPVTHVREIHEQYESYVQLVPPGGATD